MLRKIASAARNMGGNCLFHWGGSLISGPTLPSFLKVYQPSVLYGGCLSNHRILELEALRRMNGGSDFSTTLVLMEKSFCGKQKCYSNWLVVEPTHLKNISQNGNLPQVGVKIKHI